MLERRRLLDSPTVRVTAVCCHDAGRAGQPWSREEPVTGAAVVLIRRGVFQRRANGALSVADATLGYVQRSGEIQQIAHPAGGDVCTSIGVPDDVADQVARGGPVVVHPAADLAHRRLLARARADASAADLAVDLAALAAELLAALMPPSRLATPAATARRAVDDVRVALNTCPGLRLDDLAALAGLSPWYLSRVFHRVTGVTISAYRLRLRTRAALDELADGGDAPEGLAALAARAGFADQAHMTRAMRRETGLSPAAVRLRLTC